MKAIIVYSTGIYSSNIALSYLKLKKEKVDKLFFVLYSDPISAEWIENNTKHFGLIKYNYEIIIYNDYYKHENKTSLLNKKKFLSLFELYEIIQILIPHHPSGHEYPILDCFPKSEIIIYEEGLLSYCNFKPKILNKNMNIKGTYYIHYKGLLRPSAFDKQNIPDIPFNEKVYLEIIELGKRQSDYSWISELPKNKKRILLLSQHLYSWNIMSREDELNLYRNESIKLLNKGFVVLFKKHPRIPDDFCTELENSIDNMDFIRIDNKSHCPIETYAKDLDLVAAISVYSTSLLVFSHLYNIPTFHFGVNKIFSTHRHIRDEIFETILILVSVVPDINQFYKISDISDRNLLLLKAVPKKILLFYLKIKWRKRVLLRKIRKKLLMIFKFILKPKYS